MGTTTPNFSLYKPANGEVGWGTLVDANWDTVDANLTNSLPRAYLAGCQLTNNAGSPNTKVDFSAGQAQDAGNAGAMTLSAITKDISATWAVGTNNGGLAPSLTLTASTTYHAFVVKRTDTNVVDAYFDSSVTAANIPSPYTLFRRAGSLRTNGSSQIIAFVQDGDYFRLKATVLDVNTTNPGTSAVTATLTSLPTGINVQAFLNVAIVTTTTAALMLVSDLAANDEAPSATVAPLYNVGTNQSSSSTASQVTVRTNASAQIRYRLGGSDGNTVIRIVTVGWLDTRGKNG